jgi:hypothetical protein
MAEQTLVGMTLNSPEGPQLGRKRAVKFGLYFVPYAEVDDLLLLGSDFAMLTCSHSTPVCAYYFAPDEAKNRSLAKSTHLNSAPLKGMPSSMLSATTRFVAAGKYSGSISRARSNSAKA